MTLWILVDRLILQTFRNNNGFPSILTGPRFVINWMHVTGSNAVREIVLCERQERKCLLHWSTRTYETSYLPFRTSNSNRCALLVQKYCLATASTTYVTKHANRRSSNLRFVKSFCSLKKVPLHLVLVMQLTFAT